MGPGGEAGYVHRAFAVDLQEGEQGGVEGAGLEVGELVGRRHDGLGVGGASEGEAGERNASHRSLLDDPCDRAVPAFLEQDARDVGGDAEPQVDRHAGGKLHGHAPRNDLLDRMLQRLEAVERAENLAGDGGVVDGLRGLELLRCHHHAVHEDAGDAHVLGPERSRPGKALDLRDHGAPVVAGGKRLVERSQVGALVLEGEVAPLVGGGGADDRDVRRDGRKEQPVLAREPLVPHDGLGGRGRRHGAAFLLRVDEGVQPDLGQHPGPLRCRLAVHVEEDAGRDVVGGDGVLLDHPADRGRLCRRGAGGIGAAERAAEQSRPGEVVDALDGVHVAGGDGVKRGQVARTAGLVEARADRLEYGVRTAEARGGRHGDGRAIANDAGGFAGGEDLHGAASPGSTATAFPDRADSTKASAVASDQTPSSPVAEGAPSPRTAAWNRPSDRT